MVELPGDDPHRRPVGIGAVATRSHRLGLDEEPPGPVETGQRLGPGELVRRARAGHDPAIGRRHHRSRTGRRVEEGHDALAQLVQGAAGEDDLDEGPVGILESAQRSRLSVELLLDQGQLGG